jgi:hypothetical protein
MAKARPCPKCSKFFNPKFFGQKWGDTIICSDCWLRQKLKDDKQNTPPRNTSATGN